MAPSDTPINDDDEELDGRRIAKDNSPAGYSPDRDRKVSKALKAYAYFVSSADQGAVRMI